MTCVMHKEVIVRNVKDIALEAMEATKLRRLWFATRSFSGQMKSIIPTIAISQR